MLSIVLITVHSDGCNRTECHVSSIILSVPMNCMIMLSFVVLSSVLMSVVMQFLVILW
jgi:hypothetical protein